MLYKLRYLIPKSSKLKAAILYEYHDSLIGDHGGDVKTYLRVAQE